MSTVDRTKLNALVGNLDVGKFADPELLQASIEEVYDNLDIRPDNTEVLTKTNTTAFTPSANYQPATKKYTDDAINAAIVEVVGTPIIQSGTVFPSSPIEGQSFFRSDEGKFYVYSASAWKGSASQTDMASVQTDLTNKTIGSIMYAYQTLGGF